MNNLECKICGSKMTNLVSHIKNKHLMSPKEYKNKYDVKTLIVYTKDQIEKMSNSQKVRMNKPDERIKNSIRQKNGSSRLTEKYWNNKGYSTEDSKKIISEIQKINSNLRENKPEYSIFCKEYWIKKGLSESESINKIKQIQSENSKKSLKFLGKKSSSERNKKISKGVSRYISTIGIDNWLNHFNIKNGRSKIEIQFFDEIVECTNLPLKCNVSVGKYIVDVLFKNKIIEFNGDFWHANPDFYKSDDIVKIPNTRGLIAESIWKKDEERNNKLISMGYDVLVIWESDWKKNKELVLDKIKKYYEIID